MEEELGVQANLREPLLSHYPGGRTSPPTRSRASRPPQQPSPRPISAPLRSSPSPKSLSGFPAGPSRPLSAPILSLQPLPNLCPRVLPPKSSIQDCFPPSLDHPDLVLSPQIIRVHSFSEAHCPFRRRPLLPFKSAFRTPHFPSIFPPAAPARIGSRSTVPPHTEVSRRSHPTPRRHPAFPLRLSPAGRPHPQAGLPSPHQPAPGLPSPLPRRAVLHSLQVVPLDSRQSHFSPPALPVPSAPRSR